MHRTNCQPVPPSSVHSWTKPGSTGVGALFTAWILLFSTADVKGQVNIAPDNMGMYFPGLGEKDWNISVGIVTFTTPEDLTEEVRVRIPAIDLHVLRRIGKGLYADGRVLAQGVQNHFSVGLRVAIPLTDHFTFGVGDDVAYWRGSLPIQGFDSKGSGWLNYPSLSIGYRSKHDLLFTAKAELLITTNTHFTVGDITRERNTDVLSGYGYSLFMEQPFFKDTWVTLGFSVYYTDFLWATWSLFETFDRNLVYPRFTAGLIL